ncbi:hypothetical protein ACWGH8_33890 [Nonomuraea muscovyensis]|uniref:Uncharacterized protein n=2 Tax=Nonomuraea muscovyensis TaxID=1124761 RepID=A0A7X0C9K3_9ACTN|nr:hypothetical protein [Nonomuraea muscovyensis]MBB6350146.1 hypothetical protein [Nonomuraea muscovyensis]
MNRNKMPASCSAGVGGTCSISRSFSVQRTIQLNLGVKKRYNVIRKTYMNGKLTKTATSSGAGVTFRLVWAAADHSPEPSGPRSRIASVIRSTAPTPAAVPSNLISPLSPHIPLLRSVS